MEIIILGKTNDDKGTQLEKLTVSILNKLGYTNISTNEIGDGGNEIDVIGEFVQPSIKNNTTRLVLCECKAHKSPISTTDWMKFLGKVFTNELTHKNVNGCLIALNGANGNVRGMYRSLQEKRDDIQLITGEDLTDVFHERYQLMKLEQLQTLISSLTSRKIVNISICYYDQAIFWLITFANNDFTLLDHSGKIISDQEAIVVREIITNTLDFGDFIDLYEEKNQKDRLLLVEKYIMSIFLLYGKKITIADLIIQCNSKHGEYPILEFSDNEIEIALASLIKDNIINTTSGSYLLTILSKNYDQNDVLRFYKKYLEDHIVIMGLGTKIYKKFINKLFLQHIAKIQGDLPIPERILQDWIQVLQLSPSALGWIINPDRYILEHRNKMPSTPELDDMDIAYVSQQLSMLISRDFTQSELGNYFFYKCGALELATEQSLNIKGAKKSLAKIDFKERIGLGKYETGQIISLRIIANQPEPWKKPKIGSEQ